MFLILLPLGQHFKFPEHNSRHTKMIFYSISNETVKRTFNRTRFRSEIVFQECLNGLSLQANRANNSMWKRCSHWFISRAWQTTSNVNAPYLNLIYFANDEIFPFLCRPKIFPFRHVLFYLACRLAYWFIGNHLLFGGTLNWIPKLRVSPRQIWNVF